MTDSDQKAPDRLGISAIALELVSSPVARRRSHAPGDVREWIEKRLAAKSRAVGGIEIHREIEAGLPGQSIPTLLLALDVTREDFSQLLGRTRKTLNELVERKHLSRADSDLVFRIARAVVHAVSVFGDAGYAVDWLKEPNEALGGSAPLRLLATIEGDEVVHAEIGAVEHGLPA
jgi:putative toxin-antitoxin system antitoxin component (TIGR02293 family)